MALPTPASVLCVRTDWPSLERVFTNHSNKTKLCPVSFTHWQFKGQHLWQRLKPIAEHINRVIYHCMRLPGICHHFTVAFRPLDRVSWNGKPVAEYNNTLRFVWWASKAFHWHLMLNNSLDNFDLSVFRNFTVSVCPFIKFKCIITGKKKKWLQEKWVGSFFCKSILILKLRAYISVYCNYYIVC